MTTVKIHFSLLFIVLMMILPSIMCINYGASISELVLPRFFSSLISTILLLVVCQQTEKKWLKAIPVIFLTILFASNILELVSFKLQSVSFNQAFWAHFSINTLNTGVVAYPLLTLLPMVALPVLVFLAWCSLRIKTYISNRFLLSIVCLSSLLSTLLLPNSLHDLIFSYKQIQLQSLNGSERTNLFAKYNVKEPISKNELQAKAGKNLLLIYLESIERIYTDEKIFPGLTPNLQQFAKEGLTFTNVKQFPGTGWTIGGIVSTQTGVPLIQTTTGNTIFTIKYGFMKNLVGLGDVLNKAGYFQMYMGGASSSFAGKILFLKDHGYDVILGFDELRKNLTDPRYYNGWGLYDDSLLSFALPAFRELASRKQPFNLTLLTLDTHDPYSYKSKSCPEYKNSEDIMLNGPHCTDYLLGKFISELKNEPAYKNTVIALISDHLVMRSDLLKPYAKDYDRKLFVTFLNAGREGEMDNLASHFDIAPTLLSLLDVESNAEFIVGKNILDNPSDSRFDIVGEKEGISLIASIVDQQSDKDYGRLCSDANGIKGYQNEQGGESLLFTTNDMWFSLPIEFQKRSEKDPWRSFWVKSTQNRKIVDMGVTDSGRLASIIAKDEDFNYFVLSRDHEIVFSEDGDTKINNSSGYNYLFSNPHNQNTHNKDKLHSLNQLHIQNNECEALAGQS